MMSTVLSILARLSEWTVGTWISVISLGIVSAMIWEQLSYVTKRGSLPGPRWTIPFFGGIIAMVRAPYDFWHGQMALGPISWNAIIGQYFIMITESDAVRRVFEQVSADMPMLLHPNAEFLLGKDNIAFLNGPEHKELKASLLPLFTYRALSIYLSIQDGHIRRCLAEWQVKSKQSTNGMEMRPLIYDLNTNTSMSVFVGPYLTDDARKQFQRDYEALTKGILGFPLYLPGTDVYYGKVAVDNIIRNLTGIAAAAKARIGGGAEPACLLDFWMVNLTKEIKEAQESGAPAPPHSSDLEVAKVLLDFLFASQDASTSSLTFSLHLLCEHPEVLAKVRAEQALIRPDRSVPITQEMLASMKYLWCVMKEVMRFRPPATIVPHITKQHYKVNDSYTAPPGTLLIPSVWSSNRSGFTNPDVFDPERFNADRAEHLKFDKQFMTFGTGPHTCMGQRYAMNHIQLFIALMATECEFERLITPNMHEIMYLPTIYPADGCKLKKLAPRV